LDCSNERLVTNYGVVSLRPLYELIESQPDVAHLNNRTQVARGYGRLAGRLASGIASVAGFYLWGYYEENGLWRNIYLGRAGSGKTSNLRARILEELRDERAALLSTVFNREEIWAHYRRNYSSMWHEYERHVERALRKVPSTHVVWVACPELTNMEIASVEYLLIERLNPTANIARPVSQHHLQSHTEEILIVLRAAIHAHRGDRFQVSTATVAE
jgi:hypothetical protein